MSCYQTILLLCLYTTAALAFPGRLPFKLPYQHQHINRKALTSPASPKHESTNIHRAFVPTEDSTFNPAARAASTFGTTRCAASLSDPTASKTSQPMSQIRGHSAEAFERRQLGGLIPGPLAGLASSLADALAPAFTAAMGQVQSAANTNLAGVSLVKSEAPSVIPTADVIGPAQSAAKPILGDLLGNIVGAAQPLLNGAGSIISGAAEPVASLAVPLQSVILPQIESAVGPLVSAIAPAVVAGLAPAISQLSSPLGPIESGLVAPLESAIAPLLSDVVGEAVSALTGVEAPVASLLQPVLGAVDSAVLPLVTSVVSAVWPAIGPAVTPLNPVICALQPAEVPVGGDATGLIPVQCVSITSGAIVPVSTGIATMPLTSASLTPSASGSSSGGSSITSRSSSENSSESLTLQNSSSESSAISSTTSSFAAVSSIVVHSTTLSSAHGSLAQSSLASSQGVKNLTSLLPSLPATLNVTGAAVTPTVSASGTNSVLSVSPLPAVVSPSAVSGSNPISVSEPSVMTCLPAAATSPESDVAQSLTGVQQTSVANAQSSVSAAGAAPSNIASSANSTPSAASVTASTGLDNDPLQPSPAHPSSLSLFTPYPDLPSAAATVSPAASPALTPGPLSSQSNLILLTYGSQTVSFPAIMLPGGGMVASFMGSVFALPATAAAAQAVAPRMEPIAVGTGFDFDAFAQELSSRLGEKLFANSIRSSSGSPDQILISASKGSARQRPGGPQAIAQYAAGLSNSKPVVSEGISGQSAGAGLQISSCPAANGTTFVSNLGSNYDILCDTNWVGRDIEYLVTSSFDRCVDACDALNSGTSYMPCAAALFVENAPSGAADCYLKSAIDNPSSNVGEFRFQAAVLSSSAGAPAKSFKFRLSQQPTIPSVYGSGPPNISITISPSSSALAFGSTSIQFASGSSAVAPQVSTTEKLDAARSAAASVYLAPASTYSGAAAAAASSSPVKLQDISKIPQAVLNGTMIDYSLAEMASDPATGVVQMRKGLSHQFADMNTSPHFSRDGGKGGKLGSWNLFMFADSAAYTTESDGTNGHYINYASSSVATDVNLMASRGSPLQLTDNSGEFAGADGSLRGFIPLTVGESGFNAMAAQAGIEARYSVWPESSLIPFNSTSGLVLAPIIYSYTDEHTEGGRFTYSGNTLVTVTADDVAGPSAERTVGRLFNPGDVEWGNVGGFRSWGASGVGGNDGYVYFFGNVRGGLLLARSNPQSVSDKSSYQFWNGKQWTSVPVGRDSDAYVLQGSFMDIDVFYSPRHLTFVAVYTNIYADSKFYWRYLKAPQALRPSYAGGDPSVDIGEALTKYQWSDEAILLDAGTGINGGFAYAGGVHLGYFEEDDVANGGQKMLLTWTSPTGQDPASKNSAYQLGTGVVTWV